MYLAHLLTFFLAFYLVYLRRLFVVEVRQGTLCSGARGSGTAGNTLIRSLRWKPGRDHSIRRFLFGSRWEHCDLELAVDVRRRRRGGEEGGGGGGPADIESNNLTWQVGKEKHTSCYTSMEASIYQEI